MHFKSDIDVSAYFNHRSGSVNTGLINSSFEALLDHNANLPIDLNYANSNGGEIAMTREPFFKAGKYHWNINAFGNRWECDDYVDR